MVENEEFDDLTITSDDGKETHPDAGCYIFENEGSFNVPEGAVDYDIAVLRLSKPIGLTSLKLAAHEAKRGSWVTFMNYQSTSEPGYPANYSGIVTENSVYNGLDFVTGTRALPTPVKVGAYDANHLVGGASGGPVISEAGTVVGTSTNGAEFYDAEYLETVYDVVFPGAKFGLDKGGFVPNGGHGMQLDLIRQIANIPLK